MDTRYREDGDPYSPTERRPPLIKPWTWVAGGLVLCGAMAYAAWPREWKPVPVLEEKTGVVLPQQPLEHYKPLPKPVLHQAALEPDARVEALQRQLRAMQEEQKKQDELLQRLLERPEPALPAPPPEPREAPTMSATATQTKGKTRRRDMGHLAFGQPEQQAGEEPLYTITPADTKISCTVEAKQNSDVESVGTLKVNANVWDSASRRRLLIPQGSTLLVKYHSGNLVYGNQRLPQHTAILTLPNGTTQELHQEPVMDRVGQAGLVSSVDNHYWRALPAVLIQGVLRGSQQTITTANPLVGGVAGSAAQYGQRIAQPYVDTRPTILVEAGEECLVILTRELKLPEYREKRS